MTTYRWGRYWKNSKYTNKLKRIALLESEISNRGFDVWGISNPPKIGQRISVRRVQIDTDDVIQYLIESSKVDDLIRSGEMTLPGELVSLEQIGASSSGIVPYKIKFYLCMDEKVFDGYTRGSRRDTVTSTSRRAYPDNGESGNYWYVYEGIANQEPTISGQDEDWGGYKQAFKRYYSVDDGDSGQQLNVVVTLNGVTIATVNNATRKTDYPIDIDDSKFNSLTLNDQNTVEITVTDSSGATAVRRYTFKRINTAPVVTMTNAHYGEQNKPFTINFEAADPDGDEITAKLFIDDVQIKDLGTIKGKQSVTIPKIDFAKIPNGEHKIRVEAKDSYNAVGAGYADFSKNLTYAWYRLKKELSEQPSAVIVNPLAELAPGAKMTIKVCSNVMDAQPTWETVPEELYGQKYNFRNKSKTGDKWGVGVEIRIDKEKATEDSYLYGFVGAYM